MEEKTESNGSPPTSNDIVLQSTAIKPQMRKLYDPDISFEEYYYYAQKTREEEKGLAKAKLNWRQLMSGNKQTDVNERAAHDHTEVNLANKHNRLEITDEEWTNASRAFRTASGGAAFYLVRPNIHNHRSL
jgi:hypothetical protein